MVYFCYFVKKIVLLFILFDSCMLSQLLLNGLPLRLSNRFTIEGCCSFFAWVATSVKVIILGGSFELLWLRQRVIVLQINLLISFWRVLHREYQWTVTQWYFFLRWQGKNFFLCLLTYSLSLMSSRAVFVPSFLGVWNLLSKRNSYYKELQ